MWLLRVFRCKVGRQFSLMMVKLPLANLFPVGLLQLADVVTHGYWHARSEFSGRHQFMEWMRMPGDIVFVSGTFPLLWMAARAAFRPRRAPEVTADAPPLTLVQVGGPTTVTGV